MEERFTMGGFRPKTAVRIVLLLLSLVSLITVFTLFFRPICIYSDAASFRPVDVFSRANLTLLGVFLGLLVLFSLTLLLFLAELKPFRKGETAFYRKALRTVLFSLFITIGFAVLGFVIYYLDSKAGMRVENNSMGPMVFSLILTVLYAVVNMFGEAEQTEEKIPATRKKADVLRAKIISCLFILLYTVLALSSCLSDIVSMKFSGDIIDESLVINGKELLTASNLPDTYEKLAFLLFAAITFVCVLGVLAFVAVCSSSGEARVISTTAIGVDFLVIFALGIFSKYYEIVLNLNLEKIGEYYESLKLAELPETYSLHVSGTAFWYLLIAAVLTAVLLALKPFSKLGRLLDIRDAMALQSAVQETSAANTAVPESSQTDMTEEEFDAATEKDIQKKEEGPLFKEGPLSAPVREEPSAAAVQEEPSAAKPEPEEVKETFDNCPSFTEIDRTANALEAGYRKAKTTAFTDVTLPSLVQYVVKYAAESKNHLSYTEENIASFVAGLGMSRLSILQGLSGTGKTSLPKIFSEALDGRCEIVEVESSWKDKHDLLGYYNEFTKVYSPKKFTQALYRAVLTPDVPVFIVLDEMNLSRIEYYFSDFLSLMENDEDKRFIRILDRRIFNTVEGEQNRYRGLWEDNTIKVPANVWFIGTANRDESTFEISDKVYDRANTMNFLARAPKAVSAGEKMVPAFVSLTALSAILQDAISGFEFDAEKCNTVHEVERLLLPYNIAFGNRVMKQLENYVKVYCSCFENKYARVDEAVEKFLLSKVVRKLEGKNLRNRQELVHGFEKLRLFECSAFVKTLGGDSFYD